MTESAPAGPSASKRTPTDKSAGSFDTPQKTNYFLGLTLTMAWQLAAVFLLGFFGGHWLDERLDKMPLFTIIGLTLAVAGMVLVIRRVLTRLNEFMDTAGKDKA